MVTKAPAVLDEDLTAEAVDTAGARDAWQRWDLLLASPGDARSRWPRTGWTRHTAYGYERVYHPRGGAFVEQRPHPQQAEVVREIVRRVGKGDALATITKDLTRREIPALGGPAVYVTEPHRSRCCAGRVRSAFPVGKFRKGAHSPVAGRGRIPEIARWRHGTYPLMPR